MYGGCLHEPHILVSYYRYCYQFNPSEMTESSKAGFRNSGPMIRGSFGVVDAAPSSIAVQTASVFAPCSRTLGTLNPCSWPLYTGDQALLAALDARALWERRRRLQTVLRNDILCRCLPRLHA